MYLVEIEKKTKKIMLSEGGKKEKKKELFGLGLLIGAIWH